MGKTSANSIVLWPLSSSINDEERIGLEAQLKKARKAAQDSDTNNVTEAVHLKERLEQIQVPVEPRLVADDVTSEQLACLLEQQGGRIAVMSAEGGVFGIMAERYSKGGPNFDVYLKGHAGDELRVDRVGRPPLIISEPAVTMALTIQPDVLRQLASQPAFRGRGLIARFCFALPKSNIGRRKI